MDRRRFLHGAGAVGTGLLGGCIGSQDGAGDRTPTRTQTEAPTPTQTSTPTPEPIDPDDLAGYVRPDGDPDTIPSELDCENEEFLRRPYGAEEGTFQWGNITDGDGTVIFALRVDELRVERGAQVTITATNTSSGELEVGAPSWGLAVLTEAGWQDPRGYNDGKEVPIPGQLITWESGEQRQFQFEMTKQGIVDGLALRVEKDTLVTCPGLPAGRYRFVMNPFLGESVGVAFDLVE